MMRRVACTPADLLKLYVDYGAEIFKKPTGAACSIRSGQTIRAMFDVLENRLQEKLGKATLDQGLSKG